MLTIRLARVGKKNRAQFKIMLQEKTAAPGGRHVEILGSHDPHLKETVLKEDRIKHWLSKGAQMSDTAYNLFVSKGVLTGEKRKVKVSQKKAEGEESKEGETKTAEAPKEPARNASPARHADASQADGQSEAGGEAKEEAKEEVKEEEPKAEEKPEEINKEEKPASA